MTAIGSRGRGPVLTEVAPQALLAIAAAFMAVIEVGSWSEGDALAGYATVGLVVMALVLAFATWLRARERTRDSAIVAALSLLAAVPLFSAIYANGSMLAMVGLIAFALVLPHARGRLLLTFGILTIAAAVASVARQAFDSTIPASDPFTRGAPVLGTVVVSAVLLFVMWRAYRGEERQRARFERLVADLPVGVARITPDLRFAEVNEALVGILGYPSRQALVGEPVSATYVRAEDDPVGRIAPEEPSLMVGQLQVRRPDGTEAWIRYRTRRVTDADGTVLWYDSEIEDVTLERSEHEAQSQLAAVLESVPDAVFSVRPDGTVSSWNHGAERIYGVPAASIIGHDVFRIIRVAHLPRFRAVHEAVLAGRVVPPFDIEQTRADGRTVHVSVGAAPIRDADGRVIAATVVARDITEERRLYAQREELEAQLLQAQKMEAVGRLAGGVAHDFNNLLTAITGFGGLVASELRGRQLEDQLQVLRAAERAGDLTRRLLAFARNAPADPRSVSVDAVLDDAFRMVRRLVPERLELELDLHAGAYVMADPVEIEQVLINLVVNAVDATPDAGLIHVSTAMVDLDGAFADQHLGSRTGAHVLLIVSDTGVGMDDAIRERIFEPFFTTKDRGEGTGLGLATVYAVVRRSGGTVWVDSEPGAGTAFRVYLPETEAPEAPEDVPPVVGEAIAAGTGSVLLIEDEESVRALAERILAEAGYRVFAAPQPAAALAMLPDARPDVVVTDVIMPGMSGPDFVASLPIHLPVVFMTGYTGGDPSDLRLDLPTRILVPKPFEPATLARAVRTVLDAARGPAARGAGGTELARAEGRTATVDEAAAR
jgi:PAS domain S-box-containing protein